MFNFTKNGPAKVEAAFGLFTKAIKDLEVAVDTCKQEAFDYQAQANLLVEKANDSKVAADRAISAITNLKILIGE